MLPPQARSFSNSTGSIFCTSTSIIGCGCVSQLLFIFVMESPIDMELASSSGDEDHSSVAAHPKNMSLAER